MRREVRLSVSPLVLLVKVWEPSTPNETTIVRGFDPRLRGVDWLRRKFRSPGCCPEPNRNSQCDSDGHAHCESYPEPEVPVRREVAARIGDDALANRTLAV